MKQYLTYFLAVLSLLTALSISGCRGSNRQVTSWAGDRNVSVIKRKKSRVQGRFKPVTTTKYNRVKK
jgi:hypothetical protein